MTRVPVILLPPIPQDMSNDLVEWFGDSEEIFNSLKRIMILAFSERIQRLNDMPKKARDVFWWPFTQHRLVPEETVTVIDSRCGENFAVYKVSVGSCKQCIIIKVDVFKLLFMLFSSLF